MKNFCINCSTPFSTEEEEHDGHFKEKVFKISCHSSSSEKVVTVLNKIFKIDFLRFLCHLNPEEEEEIENDALCTSCSQFLSELYRLYSAFQELCPDSYVNKLIQKLDSVVQQQKDSRNFKDNSTQTPPVAIFHQNLPTIQIETLQSNPTESNEETQSDDNPGDPNFVLDNDWNISDNYCVVKIEADEEDQSKRTKGSKSLPDKNRKSQKNKQFDVRDYLSKRAKYPNPCWYCDQVDFPSPSACLEHTTQVHLPEFLSKGKFAKICQRCAKVCQTKQSMLLHQNYCNLNPPMGTLMPPVVCDYKDCGKTFANSKNLRAHKVTHAENKVPCDFEGCDFRTKTRSLLKLHKSTQHSQETSRVQCEQCGAWAKNNLSLKGHIYFMHTEKGSRKYKETNKLILARKRQETVAKLAAAPTFCDLCETNFSTPYGLTMHRKKIHNIQGNSIFCCEVCGGTFTCLWSLKIHSRVHSDERPFICEFCAASFKLKQTLTAHCLEVHFGKKSTKRQRKEKITNSENV